MLEAIQNFRWGYTGEIQDMLVDNGRVVDRYATRVSPPGAVHEAHVQDMRGRFLLPSFVDAHCHILPSGLDLKKLDLSRCESREQVLSEVLDAHRANPDGWLIAVYYDQTRYEGGADLTRNDLDKISTDRPILLDHTNGHAGVANSAALAASGVREDTPDPDGGRYRRDADGRLDGVLYETAYERVRDSAPMPSQEEMIDAILVAGRKMSDLGISTATDMMTGGFDLLTELAAYRVASERGCRIRIRLFLQYGPYFRADQALRQAIESEIAAMDPALCKVCGVKIFADGAISSATAAIYGTFTNDSPARSKMPRKAQPSGASAPPGVETDGQLIYSPSALCEMVVKAHDAGLSVATHSIGDYSTDLVMDAYARVDDPSRHRIEHAMILSDSQIERMQRLGIRCTMQPEFLMRLAHAYRRQLGPERTSKLKRAKSVLSAGVPLSFNSDRPVVLGNPWDGIRTAVDRPDGFDSAENVSVLDAVRLYTAGGAQANGEADSMGDLRPHQFADWQSYETDPLMLGASPIENRRGG